MADEPTFRPLARDPIADAGVEAGADLRLQPAAFRALGYTYVPGEIVRDHVTGLIVRIVHAARRAVFTQAPDA